MTNTIYERFASQRLGRRRVLALAGSAGTGAILAACSGKGGSATNGSASTSGDETANQDTTASQAAFSDPAHAEGDPDYSVVFPTGQVPKLTIKVTPETWTAMLANMTELFGERGVEGAGGGGGQLPGGGGQLPGGQLPGGVPVDGEDGGLLDDGEAPAGGPPAGQFPGGGGGQFPGGGGGGFSSANPDWFKGTIEFNGETWENVGVRFKGNSSLRSGWTGGGDNLPFKLDFDQWEDDVPEIKNQRFYGFKQLSLSSNYGDASYIRETLAYDMLDAAGLVAAETAVYDIYLDRGEGASSLGMYTVIEVIDDTVIKRAFSESSGNIYEADGSAASLAAGTESAIEASFQAEDGDNPDWSDIKALYAAIHDPERTTDAAAWSANLEAVFHVETFLEWMAIAAAIQHWDTYGGMTHNYYLYNDPATGKLVFISWDHNFILSASPAGGDGGVVQGGFGGRGGGGGGGIGGGRGSSSLDKADVNESWPLIRYLLDQETYYEKYLGYLRETMETLFSNGNPEGQVDAMATIIKAALPADQQSAYQATIDALKTTIQSRRQAVSDFLATA